MKKHILVVALPIGVLLFSLTGCRKGCTSCAEQMRHLCENINNVGCNVAWMDNAVEKVNNACPADKAQQFYADITADCIAQTLNCDCKNFDTKYNLKK